MLLSFLCRVDGVLPASLLGRGFELSDKCELLLVAPMPQLQQRDQLLPVTQCVPVLRAYTRRFAKAAAQTASDM